MMTSCTLVNEKHENMKHDLTKFGITIIENIKRSIIPAIITIVIEKLYELISKIT